MSVRNSSEKKVWYDAHLSRYHVHQHRVLFLPFPLMRAVPSMACRPACLIMLLVGLIFRPCFFHLLLAKVTLPVLATYETLIQLDDVHSPSTSTRLTFAFDFLNVGDVSLVDVEGEWTSSSWMSVSYVAKTGRVTPSRQRRQGS